MPRTLSVRARPAAPAPALPRHVAPMLATLAADVPVDASAYNFEWKWDGVRALCHWSAGRLRIDSRNLLDITVSYPELQALGPALGVRSAILDGEIVALDADGKPSFARLQRRMHVHSASKAAALSRSDAVWLVLFDLLYLNGRSLLDRPYVERREKLQRLTVAGPNWQVTGGHVGEGAAMLEAARANAIEGIVAKRLDGVYEPGRRSRSWLKIKTVLRQEFVVGGWVPERSGRANRVGAMLVGTFDRAGRLKYAGKVGSGLSEPDHARLMPLLLARPRATSPFDGGAPPGVAGARYVEPAVVIEVEYRRWPAGGLVQQAAYKGVREDKAARSVVRET